MNLSKTQANEMLLLVKQLADSRALGRSQVYAKLLRYLADQSIQGKACSEYAVAIDVFEKSDDYDVSVDSTVRVYIYNLRKKLETYYADKGKNEIKQLCLPKGEYRLLVKSIDKQKTVNLSTEQTNKSNQTTSIAPAVKSSTTNKQGDFVKLALFSIGLILLSVVSTLFFTRDNQNSNHPISEQQIGFWGEILNDDKPVLLVIGDFFMFAESANKLNNIRLVRELDVNSVNDFQLKNKELTTNQLNTRFDLGLTYLPRGSAHAIASIQHLLQKRNKTPILKMMSELDVTDLQTNHVIYAGHLSGLGLLEDYVSSNSRFIIGINYDVIVDTKADQLYRSNLISLQENKQPVSFGVLSSFPLTSNTKLVTLTGTDDTGLIAISDIAASQNIMQQLGIDTDDMQENMIIETLFKVTGINSTDIDNELLVTDYRNLSDIELK